MNTEIGELTRLQILDQAVGGAITSTNKVEKKLGEMSAILLRLIARQEIDRGHVDGNDLELLRDMLGEALLELESARMELT